MSRLPCEFFLVRYVPDVVKGEFVNIGVVLRAANGGGPAQVRFTRDWTRVRCVDRDADVEMLEALEQEIGARLQEGLTRSEPKAVLDVLADTLSNSLQMSDGRAALAESLAAEMDQLMRMYVEPLKVPRLRSRSGRASIAGEIRSEFERAGVWELMRKRIPAAMYTRPGDPLKIDCGYRSEVRDGSARVIRMFQAVALDTDVEMAKSLAYSAPQLREGVARAEGVPLELTAVVQPLHGRQEDEQSDGADRYHFGVDAMERQQIRVVTLSDLARVAATARHELGF